MDNGIQHKQQRPPQQYCNRKLMASILLHIETSGFGLLLTKEPYLPSSLEISFWATSFELKHRTVKGVLLISIVISVEEETTSLFLPQIFQKVAICSLSRFHATV